MQSYLIPIKLFNSPFAFCFLISIDFSLTHIVHFDNSIVLLLLAFKTLGFMSSVPFLYFR